MNENGLRVRMLGTFSIELGGRSIDDGSNRSRKIWLLLAYMIYHRSRPVTPKELSALLSGDEEDGDMQSNALRAAFHRVRGTLNQLDASAGHALIIRQGGSYAWNTRFPLRFDVEEFDALCRRAGAAEDEERRLDCYQQALELYRGDFLSKLSSEAWVMPIATYFHNLYIKAVQEVLSILEARQRGKEAVALCRRALKVEPYSEELYWHLMRNLLDMGEQKSAITAYEEMSKAFLSNFGVMPAEEIRGLYYEAIRTANDRAIPIEVMREQLREPGSVDGALICDYDFFKVIYYATARMVGRNGAAVHIGQISVSGKDGKELAARSLDRVMENLQEQIRVCLRRGDIVARCSVSQFVLLLPQANYENSCMVCERISKAFHRKYPHSPAELRYSVQALETSD